LFNADPTLEDLENMDQAQFNTLVQALTGLTAQLNNNTPAPTPTLPVTIPLFYGCPHENVNSWFISLENIFTTRAIVEDVPRIRYAATGMKDAAASWWMNKLIAEPDITQIWNNWDAFKISVKNSFQPENYQIYLRDQLKRLRQNSSVRDYATQFRNLVGQIDGMHDLDQVSYFIDGLKSNIKMEIKYRNPDSLNNAIDIATRYDTALWGINKGNNFNSSRHNKGSSNFNNNNNYNNSGRNRYNNNSGPEPMDLDSMKTSYQKNKYGNNHNNSNRNNSHYNNNNNNNGNRFNNNNSSNN